MILVDPSVWINLYRFCNEARTSLAAIPVRPRTVVTNDSDLARGLFA